jgi:hypothetical protein
MRFAVTVLILRAGVVEKLPTNLQVVLKHVPGKKNSLHYEQWLKRATENG